MKIKFSVQTVFRFTLIISVMGITAAILPVFLFQSFPLSEWILSLHSLMTPVNLDLPFLKQLLWSISFSLFNFQLLGLLFNVLLLIGGISFIRMRKSGLLKFLILILFIANVFYLLLHIVAFRNIFDWYDMWMMLFQWILHALKYSAYIFVTFKMYRTISEGDVPLIRYDNEKLKFRNLTSQATTGQRFVNRCIDFLVFLLLYYSSAGIIANSFYGNNGQFSNSGVLFYTTLYLMELLFYCLMEYLFRRTPGKIITGTMVVKEDNARMTFNNALSRTLLRFIPLEPFTIFFRPILHDSISKTYVVVLATKENEQKPV